MSDLKPIVEIKGITKEFKAKKALDNVSVDIYPGRIIGMLGPNGSGKSTLIRHIIGLYLPTKGTCTTFGCDAAKLGPKELSRIGYVHQEGELLDWMNVNQLIRYVSAYYPNWNYDLENLYIHDFEIGLWDRVGALSPGQRQKLAILLAIGHNPDLLILDEPASALDPIARAQFLDLLLKIIQQEGKTILISSHILSDVEKVIDHVLIMKSGLIIQDENFDDLRERYMRVRLTSLDKALPERLPFEDALSCQDKKGLPVSAGDGSRGRYRIHSCQRSNGQALLTVEGPGIDVIREDAEAMHCSIDVHSLPLEEIYKVVMES